ncbi:MAG TPA: hypothetical protein DCW71_08255 [Alistipes sp.]|nr:hypothetical protein [Alistipes sp.]
MTPFGRFRTAGPAHPTVDVSSRVPVSGPQSAEAASGRILPPNGRGQPSGGRSRKTAVYAKLSQIADPRDEGRRKRPEAKTMWSQSRERSALTGKCRSE